jgi:hypothetical protein
MSKVKSTPKPKAIEPKARYNNGNKVFINCYAFAGLGMILEGEVRRSDSQKYPVLSENGKIIGNSTHFTYIINTAKGEFEVGQDEVYPSYLEAAKVFGKAFLYLLK